MSASKRKRRAAGHGLEEWEVSLVMAMLATKRWSKQEIHAHFSHPARPINQARISQIASGIVQVGKVKSFTDIGGMHILHLDRSDRARNDLAKRLDGLGCDVDTDGDHWLRAGDFTPTPARGPKKRKGKQ
jgi:hypothetical protein